MIKLLKIDTPRDRNGEKNEKVKIVHMRARIRNNWRARKVGRGGLKPLSRSADRSAAAADAAAAATPAIRSRASRIQPPSR